MIFRVIEAGHLPFSKDYGGDGRRRQTWSQFDEITIIALTASRAAFPNRLRRGRRNRYVSCRGHDNDDGGGGNVEQGRDDMPRPRVSASGSSNGQAQFYSLCDGKDKIGCVILRCCYMMPSSLACDQTDHSSNS